MNIGKHIVLLNKMKMGVVIITGDFVMRKAPKQINEYKDIADIIFKATNLHWQQSLDLAYKIVSKYEVEEVEST